MVQQLIDGVQHTMKHALENEEKIPLEKITDFEEVDSKTLHECNRPNGYCYTNILSRSIGYTPR